MPLKFAANIQWLFTEVTELTERFQAAKAAGFQAAELNFPYDTPLETIKAARASSGLEHVLINGWPGDMKAGDMGIAAVPSKVKEFRDKLEVSIQYCKALECKRLHVLAGKKSAVYQDVAMEETYVDNLSYAADRLQKEGILAVIEPINSRISAPLYFLDHPQKAVDIIKKVNHPNLKLQLDIFHLQIMNGNLTGSIQSYLPLIGHIQVSQVPDRGEPFSPGEINYEYVFKVLEEAGYDGWIGLEYKPTSNTQDSIKWMKERGYLQ